MLARSHTDNFLAMSFKGWELPSIPFLSARRGTSWHVWLHVDKGYTLGEAEK